MSTSHPAPDGAAQLASDAGGCVSPPESSALPESPAAHDGPAARDAAPRTLALSPSRAADFRTCPLRYRFRVLDRIPEPATEAQLRGVVVHAVLERLFTLPAERRDAETARTLVEPVWEEILATRSEAAPAAEVFDVPTMLARARRIVRRYFEVEDPSRFDPRACEARLEVALEPDPTVPGGVPLRGIVDRIDLAPDGRMRVVDYKTGRVPGERGESGALFQLKFYALMLWRRFDRVPDTLRLFYVADSTTLDYAPDPDELVRFERIVRAVWRAIVDGIESRDFRPNPGPICRFCDHRPLCPAFGGTAPTFPTDLPVVATDLPVVATDLPAGAGAVSGIVG